jgi:hypothetical protein
MKKSGKRVKLLDFGRDVASVASDAEALRSLKELPRLDTKGYLDYLSSLPASRESLRKRKGPDGDQPFTLLPSCRHASMPGKR